MLPLQPASSPVNFGVEANTESDVPKLSNLVGAGYQAFEESVLDKLKKVGATVLKMLFISFSMLFLCPHFIAYKFIFYGHAFTMLFSIFLGI